ncbi:double zinc ribbon domain-containing protein [Clostridium sp. AF29-8BH]
MIKNIKWNQFPRAALDALYPRRCPVCGEIVTPKGGLICPRVF